MKYLFIKYVHKLNCTNYMKNFKVDLAARAHVFQPFGPGSIHSKSLFFPLSSYYQNYVVLGLLYNLINPIFQHLSLTSTAAILPFPSLVILFLPSLSLSLSSCFSTPLRRYVSSLFSFFFFLVCVCYFAWCLMFGW